MSVKTSDAITAEFTTANPTTGAAADADSLPTGTLVINGTDNGATVTVTNIDTGRYKAAVTLPTIASGDTVQLAVAATVSSVAGKAIIWTETGDTKRNSDLNDAAAVSAVSIRSEIDSNSTQLAAIVNDTNELQTNQGNWLTATGFSTHSAADVWLSATRTLTSYGSLAGDTASAVWDTLLTGITTVGSIGKLIKDYLDAAISTRSTYAGADTAGTTTLLSRIIGTLAAGTHNAQSGDSYARLGAPAGASVSADVAAVNAKTTNLPATPAATGDAMTLTAAYDAAKTAAQAGDAMALTAGERTTLAAALWNALTSGLSTVGSIGKLLVDNINATISSRLASASYTAPLDASATATAVQTGMTAQGYDSTRADALDLVDWPITGVPAAVWGAGTRTLTSGAAPSAADNAAAVWDLAIAGHTTAGSTGEKLNAAGASGDFLASAVPGAYADGTAGAALGNIPAIKAKTDLLAAATAPEIRAGVTSAGDVYLYLGADHSADDMAWIFTDAGDWPDLTGLTVKVNIRKTDTTLLQLTPTVTGEGTANQVIRAEPTAAQTAGFTIGRKSYAVWVTNGGGDTWPIFSGDVLVENLPH